MRSLSEPELEFFNSAPHSEFMELPPIGNKPSRIAFKCGPADDVYLFSHPSATATQEVQVAMFQMWKLMCDSMNVGWLIEVPNLTRRVCRNSVIVHRKVVSGRKVVPTLVMRVRRFKVLEVADESCILCFENVGDFRT